MATPPSQPTNLPSPRSSPNGGHDTNDSSSSPTSTQKPKRSLRILCFGDSLTSGYPFSHPYATSLTSILSRALPNLHIEPHVDGSPGDTVVGGTFLQRIEPKFLAVGGGNPFDWTVVLGGTNDLSFAIEPATVFAGLRRVWAVPLSKGGRVLACTVPETGGGGWRGESLAKRRDALNKMIREHKQENFHVFDLNAAIPYASMRDEERSKYWDDLVHLTPAGYDLMGERIAAALVELIMPPGRLQPVSKGTAPPRKRRKVFRDDDKVFEEEDGDDTNLEHGYYVVRRKDLE